MFFFLMAAVLPAAILFWYVYSRDVTPEPGRVVMKGFLYGAISTVVSTFISGPLMALGLFSNNEEVIAAGARYTGTMAYLEFEAMGIDRVRTELSVAYVDHNPLQCGFENADDHRYIQSVAKKHGLRFSRPGNGICHQVHLERFGVPGKTLIGSDSHTPTGGGIGMLAFGAGGMDAEALRAQIRSCKEKTRHIFGVNLMLMNPQAADCSLSAEI